MVLAILNNIALIYQELNEPMVSESVFDHLLSTIMLLLISSNYSFKNFRGVVGGGCGGSSSNHCIEGFLQNALALHTKSPPAPAA